ncbi:MAG: WD40 repeat domain-containing protein [Pedobacter sp.]|jgi:WD40 repeat protein
MTKKIDIKKIKKILFSLDMAMVLSIFAIIVTVFYFYPNFMVNKPKGLLHELNHNTLVMDATFSPDSKYIATGSSGSLFLGLFNVSGATRVWDVESGRLLHTFHADYVRPSMIKSVKFSPDSKLIASCATDGVVRLWDVKSGKLMLSLVHRTPDTAAPMSYCKINFSHNGKMLATAVSDWNVKVWNVETGQLLQTFSHTTSESVDLETRQLLHDTISGYQEVYNGIFSNDDKLVITGDGDVTAKIWDVKTGNLLRILSNPTPHLFPYKSRSHVTLSNDGKQIMLYSDYFNPEIWDLNTGAFVHVLASDMQTIQKFVPEARKERIGIGSGNANFSHNNRLIINGGFLNLAQIWQVNTGELLLTLKHGEPKGGQWVERAVFSPSDDFVLTASTDGTTKLWDTKSGRLVTTFYDTSSDDHGYKPAEFSNNGKYIFTTKHKTVSVWKFIPNI